MRRLQIAWLALAVAGCDPPPNDAEGACAPCAQADTCCAARTANPGSNCKHRETCSMFTGDERATVIEGCRYYLRVGSTPPAPAACGPHPEAD
jgi:hypothetical protein